MNVFIETEETLKFDYSAPLSEKQTEKLKEYKKRAIDQNAIIFMLDRDAENNLYLYARLQSRMITGVKINTNGEDKREYLNKEEYEYLTKQYFKFIEED